MANKIIIRHTHLMMRNSWLVFIISRFKILLFKN